MLVPSNLLDHPIEAPETPVSGVFVCGQLFHGTILCGVNWLRSYPMEFGFFLRAGVVAVLVMLPGCFAQAQFGAPPESSAFSIAQAQLIQPEELSQLLKAGGVDKPLVLQVGSRVLFEQAHIAGAEYAGAGSQAAGLQQLQGRVAPLPRKTFIVLYCGCCPWNRCPNIAPAIKLLRDLGFTRVKALYIADNFGTDWADKGYPVERSR
jgi:thiosulfate/3-mercaptopyruvate sulfurtransferase